VALAEPREQSNTLRLAGIQYGYDKHYFVSSRKLLAVLSLGFLLAPPSLSLPQSVKAVTLFLSQSRLLARHTTASLER
jgi:hypothetical protein